MFKDWQRLVQELNTNKNESNIEEARRIQKKYRTMGRTLKIIGIISLIASVSLFIYFQIT